MKKNNKIKNNTLLFVIIAIITIFVVLILIFSGKKSIKGSWISTGGTIYEFGKNNQGVMKVSIAEYEFTYKIKKNNLSIDFASDKANDVEYEYSFEKDKLILKGTRGTFTFSKYTNDSNVKK